MPTVAAAQQPLSAEFLVHCKRVANAFADGEVVPFLGAGVNLCGRPEGESWKKGEYLPSGAELSEYLAARCSYPMADADNLVRVSQYQATMEGDGPLFNRLREVFDADYRPTPFHQLLARMPKMLEEEFGRARYQLIVTTNYDDALERAFVEAGQPFDLFTYVALGEENGKFLYTTHDEKALTAHGEKPRLITSPRRFTDPVLERRSAIVKIHGAVDRSESRRDSYVITEDHYLDFLQRTEISKLAPRSLIPTLQTSHFLFLGYSLKDWNLRVILQRIWEEQERKWTSWAVQRETTPLDEKFWIRRNVEIHVVDLLVYARALEDALRKAGRERRQQ